MSAAVTSVGAHRLGPVEAVPVGEGRAYVVGAEQVAVFRLRDGSLRALSAVCPHAGGPIADGQIDRAVVICPLHLHTFELDTGRCRTGQPPLRSYRAEVDADGQVVVHVERLPARLDGDVLGRTDAVAATGVTGLPR